MTYDWQSLRTLYFFLMQCSTRISAKEGYTLNGLRAKFCDAHQELNELLLSTGDENIFGGAGMGVYWCMGQALKRNVLPTTWPGSTRMNAGHK
jgi:predicted NAD-dependent protein-ADP-ribosyltransferase YbiA (DUF1768 family)